MERKGKTLTDLGDGHPRRVADAKNAWRKASPRQRGAILAWIIDEDLPVTAEDTLVEKIWVTSR